MVRKPLTSMTDLQVALSVQSINLPTPLFAFFGTHQHDA